MTDGAFAKHMPGKHNASAPQQERLLVQLDIGRPTDRPVHVPLLHRYFFRFMCRVTAFGNHIFKYNGSLEFVEL